MNIWITLVLSGALVGSTIIGKVFNSMPLAYGISLIACGICLFEIFHCIY